MLGSTSAAEGQAGDRDASRRRKGGWLAQGIVMTQFIGQESLTVKCAKRPIKSKHPMLVHESSKIRVNLINGTFNVLSEIYAFLSLCAGQLVKFSQPGQGRVSPVSDVDLGIYQLQRSEKLLGERVEALGKEAEK